MMLKKIDYKGKTEDGRTIYEFTYEDGRVEERTVPKEVQAAHNKILRQDRSFKDTMKRWASYDGLPDDKVYLKPAKEPPHEPTC